jgi:hypothetical protein
MRAADSATENQPEPTPFLCPVCGSTKYTPHHKDDGVVGPGGKHWVSHHECDGCSIHFGDPKKFGGLRN